ncbi:hypothetical protein BJ508DRAFT_85571 [Ascobolus immersus RN42]|uniref:Uncharacterized protein n=1 Tax=Ascobolus immersus RN42 TaxID=1160509 RepID=A0A3N4HBC4_ASCIM|nr:hypothetical protein BJ508DRAFT_85571 [Ascobolus immersus RN42]
MDSEIEMRPEMYSETGRDDEYFVPISNSELFLRTILGAPFMLFELLLWALFSVYTTYRMHAWSALPSRLPVIDLEAGNRGAFLAFFGLSVLVGCLQAVILLYHGRSWFTRFGKGARIVDRQGVEWLCVSYIKVTLWYWVLRVSGLGAQFLMVISTMFRITPSSAASDRSCLFVTLLFTAWFFWSLLGHVTPLVILLDIVLSEGSDGQEESFVFKPVVPQVLSEKDYVGTGLNWQYGDLENSRSYGTW